MKYILILPDGMADLPIKGLGGKTPLEYAHTPYMDYMSKNGIVGCVKTVPTGIKPGSDIANMSILGVNPKKVKIGRGALEALAMGLNDLEDKIIFRANFVTIRNNIMEDYTGGGIKSKTGKKIINHLNKYFKNKGVRFVSGLDYRNIAIIDKDNIDVKTIPPHDILNKKINNYLPKGKDSKFIIDIMNKTSELIKNSNIKSNTNMIWLWGEGKINKGFSFEEKYGVKGAVISAVDIIKGIARYLGMDVIKVKRITGDIDTAYNNKAKAALKNLDKYDFIFVHIEAPDEAGHRGNPEEKVEAIEKIDKDIVGFILNNIKSDTKIILLPDHPTPCKLRTHTDKPVPFVIYNTNKNNKSKINKFSEKICLKRQNVIRAGYKFLEYIMKEKI